MRVSLSFALCSLLLACGSSTSGTTCGPGTVKQDGQCVPESMGGAAGSGGGAGLSGSGGGSGGGDAGSAGTVGGSAGAATSDPCSGKGVVATGSSGLIDDFEDGNVVLPAEDGRYGVWFLTGAGCTFSPTKLAADAPVAGATVDNSSAYAVHINALECPPYNFALGTVLNLKGGLNCAYDASAYDGLYFWAVGDGVQMEVGVGLRSVEPTNVGGDGTCAQDSANTGCWDRHIAKVTLTADWQLYSFAFSDLQQAGWGTAATWDPTIVADLVFLVSSDQTTPDAVDYSIDNVGFYSGTPPTTPP